MPFSILSCDHFKEISMKKIIQIIILLNLAIFVIFCTPKETNEHSNTMRTPAQAKGEAITLKLDANCFVVTCDSKTDMCDDVLIQRGYKVGDALPGTYILAEDSQIKCHYSKEERKQYIEKTGMTPMFEHEVPGVTGTDIVSLTFCQRIVYEDGTSEEQCEL